MFETAEPGLGIRLLTGDGADGLLGAAVAAMGGHLDEWTLSQVDHRPASGTTTVYAARVWWPDGDRAETLGAHLSARPETGAPDGSSEPVPGVATVSDGEHHRCCWIGDAVVHPPNGVQWRRVSLTHFGDLRRR